MTGHLDDARSAGAVLRAFLRLGLTSFGGPTAHIGYFRTAFVEQRRWLSEEAFARYFAFAQLLPGPTSSQLGMLIGLHRAGLPGAACAWLGFTLPSALLLTIAGVLGLGLGGSAHGLLLGLAAAAVGVVAHAVWGMAKGLCPDTKRRLIAVLGFALTALVAGAAGQLLTLAAGAAAGYALLPRSAAPATFETAPLPPWLPRVALVTFLLLLLPILLVPFVAPGPVFGLVGGILYAGTFIVGGGHVVLPLLESTVVQPGFLEPQPFLAGYGLAQAVPGPLFTIAAFLGAAAPAGGVLLALVCLVAIFLPSTLLMLAVLPHWQRLQAIPAVQPMLQGMAAAVTGLLAAALAVVLVPKAITSPGTAAIAAVVAALVFWGRLPAWSIVLAAGLAGLALDPLGLM